MLLLRLALLLLLLHRLLVLGLGCFVTFMWGADKELEKLEAVGDLRRRRSETEKVTLGKPHLVGLEAQLSVHLNFEGIGVLGDPDLRKRTLIPVVEVAVAKRKRGGVMML